MVLQESSASRPDSPTRLRPDPAHPLTQAHRITRDVHAYEPQAPPASIARAAAAQVAEITAEGFDGAGTAATAAGGVSAWRRRVQQVALGAGGRSVVRTAEELQEAVSEGVLYIEVRGHLDFTSVAPLTDTEGKLLLRVDAGRVNAIWVRPCSP